MRFLERTNRPAYSALTKLLMFGGELLDVGLLQAMAERLGGVRLINHYGPTETTIGCCYNEFRLEDLPPGGGVPIGRPIWNTRAYVVDESLRPVKVDLAATGARLAESLESSARRAS